MKILIQKLNSRIWIILTPIILAFIAVSFQNPAFADEDKEKIVALSNWATIEYSDLFFKNYDGPLSGLGYRYTFFPDSESYIGIKNGTNNLDVYLNGEIIPIGSVADIMATMAASNNGIFNLSGISVSSGVIPAIFSPGNGILASIEEGAQGIATFKWTVATNIEICILTASFDIGGNSVFKLTLSREIVESGNTVEEWTLLSTDNGSIKGVEHDSTTLKITEDIELIEVSGGGGALTISAGGTLKFKFF